MFEYIGALIGMHHVDGLISSAQAEDPVKPPVVHMGPPRPTYRVPRDQRIEVIRKRLAQQLEADKTTQDPYQDMWDPAWISKKDQ